jgi:hypothetical protein
MIVAEGELTSGRPEIGLPGVHCERCKLTALDIDGSLVQLLENPLVV